MTHTSERTDGMRRMVWISLLVFGILVAHAWGAKKPEELNPNEPAEAYLALVRGDTARENGDFAGALKAYEDALARYERIAAVHPEWESDIVQYRIQYCRQQIAEVQEKMPDETGLPAASEQSDQTSEPGVRSDETDTLSEANVADVSDIEKEYLRNRIAELLQQVGELEEELEKQSGQADAARLQAQMEEARKRADAAEAKAAELENEVRRLSRALADCGDQASSAKTAETDSRYMAMIQEALQREQDEQWRGALALYEQAKKREPKDTTAVLGQARCLMHLGQVDKALAILAERKDAGDSPEGIVLRASALGILGRYNEAAALLEPLWREGSTDPWVCNLLGAARLAMGQYDEAREALEKAVEQAPDFSEPLYNLAVWCIRTTNDIAEARKFYQKSIELGGLTDPDLEALLSAP